MGDEVLNTEQLEMVKRYWRKLGELKNAKIHALEWSDESLARTMYTHYKLLIEPLDNNPEKAAQKHYDTVRAINDAIVLTGGCHASDTDH